MSLTPEQLADYHRDGYVIVPDVFGPEVMDKALVEVEHITYGKSYAHWAAENSSTGRAVADGISSKDNPGRSQFPTGVPVLDKLIENPSYLDIFEQLLDTRDLHYCNAHLFVRAGPTDSRHPAHPWEGYHIDHDTNTFLPPWTDPGSYDYINSGVYLHDVEEDGAPMSVIPGSHHVVANHLCRFVREGVANSKASFTDIRKVKEFAPLRSATAKKGSAIFYSSYLVHSAVPFRNKRIQRALWTVSIARAQNQGWTRFSVPYKYGDREYFVPFWEQTSTRVRTLMGWPPPGHPYYSAQTLELLADSFPNMDLSPYR